MKNKYICIPYGLTAAYWKCNKNMIMSLWNHCCIHSLSLCTWRPASPSSSFSSSLHVQQRQPLSWGDADGAASALIVWGGRWASYPRQPQGCPGHGGMWSAQTQKQLFLIKAGKSGRCWAVYVCVFVWMCVVCFFTGLRIILNYHHNNKQVLIVCETYCVVTCVCNSLCSNSVVLL